jgi:CRISPR-associated exonuclease Cas4
MVHGNEAEAAIDRLEKRRKLTEFGLAEGRRRFHVWLASERLGLSGKLDLLIETAEERFPVDFKFSEAQVHSNHRVQLAAYALLLEERTDRPVEEGFVYLIPREEIVAVPLSAELKAQVVELLAVIRTAIVRQVFPEPTAVPVRCENCEFANFCADVF